MPWEIISENFTSFMAAVNRLYILIENAGDEIFLYVNPFIHHNFLIILF